jgi:DNA-binding LacI/PurR family transcriptional regulator
MNVTCNDNRHSTKSRLTLGDIARRASVSVATVSRIVNRKPNVDPILARRVKKVIEQEGYLPNTHARALVLGRSRIFGLMISEIVNLFFPEIVQRFTELGVEHGYDILLSSITTHPSNLDKAANQMIERSVDGVAVLAFEGEETLVEAFRSGNVPTFAVELDCPGPGCKSLRIDYEHGIRQAVQHLAALGHEDIAFITGPLALKTAVARKSAFLQCMQEIGRHVNPHFLVDGDCTVEGGRKAMCSLMASPGCPSAVLCSNDLTAIGLIREAFERSLNVPRDLSVIGFDDIRLAEYMIPPLTTVRISQTEIANRAFHALLDLVQPGAVRTAHGADTVKTNLILRHSTALGPGRNR